MFVMNSLFLLSLWDLLLHFSHSVASYSCYIHSSVLFQVAGEYFFLPLLSVLAHDKSSLLLLVSSFLINIGGEEVFF